MDDLVDQFKLDSTARNIGGSTQDDGSGRQDIVCI